MRAGSKPAMSSKRQYSSTSGSSRSLSSGKARRTVISPVFTVASGDRRHARRIEGMIDERLDARDDEELHYRTASVGLPTFLLSATASRVSRRTMAGLMVSPSRNSIVASSYLPLAFRRGSMLHNRFPRQ